MNKNHPRSLWAVVISLALATLACNLPKGVAPTQSLPTAFPTDVPSPIVIASPTSAPPPAVENTPAPTLEVPPTQEDNPIMADVRGYYGKGYLPYENGKLTSLPDFSISQPAMEVHDFTRTRVEVQDFALWADVELNTIGSTTYPNYTGCGFAYRVQSNSQGYTAILTNDYVRMGACSAGMRQCELFGTLYGTGEVNVGNKTKTRFSLIVSRDRAYVLVDGILAGQYSQYTSKLLGMGELYYDAVSNYGAGYWTTCKMTNIQLWESYP